eukprot:scaffold16066_cov109-Cylindrotheca_fusiformis.AAC.5
MAIRPRTNDPFSKGFYHMLSSKTIQSNISDELHSKGFTSSNGDSSSTIPILSLDMCQTLRDVLPGLFRGNFETNVYPDEWHWREGISRPDAAREMCNSWKSSRTVASVVLNEALGEFISKIMGWESVRIAQDDIVWKPPQPLPMTNLDYIPHHRIDTVGFHQDSAYISTQFEPYENNSVTLWIALDDADEETGCLEYVAGSHQWRPILHRESKSDNELLNSGSSSFHGSDEKNYRSGELDRAYDEAHNKSNEMEESDKGARKQPIQSAAVQAGCALLHHQDVWHGSGPNTSDSRHRRALVAHYLRGDVTFVESSDESPFGASSYIYGRYKKYNSTEVDESFFPIVYSAPGGEKKRTEWLDGFNLTTLNDGALII